MHAIDLKGDLDVYILDEDRLIPKAHLSDVCKRKCGNETCRYICLSIKGFVCVKNTPIKATLDELVDQNKMTAQGDNCEGLG